MTKKSSTCDVHISSHCALPGGPGSWLALIIRSEVSRTVAAEVVGGSLGRTSKEQVDLLGAIASLKQIRSDPVVELIRLWTAGSYVKQVMTTWRFLWEENGWTLSTGKSVKNRQLIEELIAASEGLNVQWLCLEHGDHLPEQNLEDEDDLIG